MHMKKDAPFFRRFFIVGIILACIVYGIVLVHVLEHRPEVVGRTCSADVAFPAWAPHPDVWLLVGAIAASATRSRSRGSVRGSRPRARRSSRASRSPRSRRGVLALWVASDWPIHDLAERYLFSVHMVQHITYSIIAAPLLLIGTPTWLARWLLSPRWLLRTVRYLARLIPATILFNLVVIVTHTPVVVNASLHARAPALRDPRADLRVVADRVDAAAEPAARGAAPAAARADALPVPAVGRADGARRRSSPSATTRSTSSTRPCRASGASRRSTTCSSRD